MNSDLPKRYVELYTQVARIRKGDKMVPVTCGPPPAAGMTSRAASDNSDLIWKQPNSTGSARNFWWAWKTSWGGFWGVWGEWLDISVGVEPKRDYKRLKNRLRHHPAARLAKSLYLAHTQRNTPVGLIEAAKLKKRYKK